MPKAILSILGLYNFDNTIFDNFHLPQELSSNKELIVNNILMDCAEFEILYPDSDFMKFAIDKWSSINLPVWQHLYETTQYEYDPIYNYDRTEKWTEEDTRKIQNDRTPNLDVSTTYGKTDTLTHNTTDTITHNTTDTLTHNTTETLTHGHIVTEAQNSYENAGMVDATKQTNSGNDANAKTGTEANAKTGTEANAKTGTETNVGSGTDSTKTTGTDKNIESHSGKIIRDGRMFGNIGVTSSQDLINQEREIALFNIMEKIVDDFKMRFCLLIY